MQKTTLRQNVKGDDRAWFIVDATDKTLGRLSTDIAVVLRGRHRPDYTPHVDGGDYVIVTNIEKVAVTGKKEDRKNYFSHSGYLGHLKIEKLKDVREKRPERIFEEAVKGMLPKNRHRKEQMRRLFLIQGSEHKYTAQTPEPLPELTK
ncbi:MAG TPA: 50S ribosomal protein L13 [Candidatus Gracilibacteria bacterium]